MSENNCWHCGHPPSGSPFCHFCSHIQPPVPDYFQFFGVGRKLSLEPAELQKRFYTMSRLLHPDRYTNAGPRDRQYSLEATAVLNDAYRVLKDPVARAEYFLKEEGFSKDVPADLNEIFELNEAVQDAATPEEMEALRARVTQILADADNTLKGLFVAHDAGPSEETLTAIRAALNRRRYVEKLRAQLDCSL